MIDIHVRRGAFRHSRVSRRFRVLNNGDAAAPLDLRQAFCAIIERDG